MLKLLSPGSRPCSNSCPVWVTTATYPVRVSTRTHVFSSCSKRFDAVVHLGAKVAELAVAHAPVSAKHFGEKF